MILFDEDWDNHPGAIVHNATTNESFKKLAYVYKKRGIKNHMFLLALHDPDLEFVDPHSSDLTMMQMLAIAKEARENYWYYLREIIKLDATGSPEPMSVIANRGIIAQAWNFWNYVNTMFITIRQKGKSLSHDILYTHVLHLSGTNAKINLLTKDSVLRAGNVERMKDLYAGLPESVRTASNNDKMNTDVIENTVLGNEMKILLAQKSKVAAINVGRGNTVTVHGVDEVSYDYNIDLSLPAMLAAGTTAKKIAMENGQPAGTCLYTTVGYLDSKSGAFAYELYEGGVRWSDEFYDLPNREALKDLLQNQCTGIMDLMIIEFNHSELGMTDDELRDAIKAAGASGVQAEVEFLNKWQKGSSTSVLSRDLIKTISKSEVEPLHTEISPNGFAIRWYVDKELYKSKPFVFGLDLSEMIGSDSGALVALDPVTGETIFAGDYNTANINDFGEFIFWILETYQESVLIAERKSVAMAVIDQIYNLFGKDENIFKRIFNKTVDNGDIYNMNRGLISMYEQYTPERQGFGYMTSGSGPQSRNALYSKLTTVGELLGNVMRDKALTHQIIALEMKNNRIDHSSGEHDDLVISYLMCYWFLVTAKNIDYYGLNKNSILAVVDSGDNDAYVENRKQTIRIAEMINEINDILTVMLNEPNPIIRSRHLASIRRIKRQIGDVEIKTLNIEARLEEVKEKYDRR